PQAHIMATLDLTLLGMVSYGRPWEVGSPSATRNSFSRFSSPRSAGSLLSRRRRFRVHPRVSSGAALVIRRRKAGDRSIEAIKRALSQRPGPPV
ncbi:hypothetical protein THAOC_21948, partial [Thalassiosira oceanica]